MRHLESQQSLPTLGKDAPSLSALARKLRLAPNHQIAIIFAPPHYLAELPVDKPVAFVKIDDDLTALRFKRT